MRSIGYNKIINIALAGLSSDVRILLDVAEEALPPDFMRNASSSSRDPSSLLGHIHTSYLLSCLRTQHCLDTVANLRQVLHFGSLFVLQPTQPPSLEHEMSTERPTPDIVHSDIVVLIFRFHGDASHLNVVRRKLARTRRNLLPHQTMLIVGVMDDDGDNDSNVCRHLKCISDILRRVGGRGGAALSQLTVQWRMCCLHRRQSGYLQLMYLAQSLAFEIASKLAYPLHELPSNSFYTNNLFDVTNCTVC
ncbi:hypothetical protein ECG_05155 [Echinococcus granulosus]|nr:hypothetical protein ECG_05155 [Echinococcus granulosus]